jgi:hypothetical protein
VSPSSPSQQSPSASPRRSRVQILHSSFRSGVLAHRCDRSLRDSADVSGLGASPDKEHEKSDALNGSRGGLEVTTLTWLILLNLGHQETGGKASDGGHVFKRQALGGCRRRPPRPPVTWTWARPIRRPLQQEISPDQSKIWTSTTVTSSGLGVTPDYGFLTLPVGLTAGSASG